MKKFFSKKILILVCVLLIALMALFSMHDNLELALSISEELILAHDDKQVFIDDENQIQAIVNMFPTEYDIIKKSAGDERGYVLLFVYEDDQSLEIIVVDQETIIYDGWKCKAKDSYIDTSYFDKMFSIEK